MPEGLDRKDISTCFLSMSTLKTLDDCVIEVCISLLDNPAFDELVILESFLPILHVLHCCQNPLQKSRGRLTYVVVEFLDLDPGVNTST